MDSEAEVVLTHYKHFIPSFSAAHATVYKLLWRVHPMQVEEIAKQTNLSNATTYRIIHDLLYHDLIKRTNFKPVGYHAPNPVKEYKTQLKKFKTKMLKGAERIKALIENSSGLSQEIYLIKRDGGQQKLITKKTRTIVNQTEQLLQIKKAAEDQLKEIDKQKLKTTAIYR